MNAAAVIFPTAVKLLCRWHISKDVLAKGKREIRDWHSSTDVQAIEEKETQEKDMAETLCDKWAKVVLAITEAEYIHQLKELENEFQRWPKFIHYLHQTWKHKERFIAAWTDQHMYFGNTSTNRVEGPHSSFKRALTSSKYDFLGMWHMIHPLLTVQITEITASFERSLICVKHDHDILCFQNIRGFVSINALDLIVGEMRRCRYSDLGARPEFLVLIDRYKNSRTDQQVFMLKQMLELGNPQCSGLLQLLVKTKTKGRPFGWRKELPKVDNSTKCDPSEFELEMHEFNSSKSAKPTEPTKKKLKVTKSTVPPNKKMNVLKTPQSFGKVSILKFPDFFRPFIIDANNVDGDGNCGFRAVAACMEMDSENG
ncbi:Far1-related sequence [Thalictrum thalictroides]|uniref:Far1-related sequence n=1 Tax=Thalictrum thalictroides TaxID=46969 RepID=A0A7J6VKA3_THATH|nr:Far1-related sequence [Thalictrum thalictroides]